MRLKDLVQKAAFVDILRGMSVTGTYFVVDKVTVEYPKEKLQPYPRFRGAQALLTDSATGEPKCVACMLCATICPSGCIRITGEQTADGRSRPAEFEIDLSRCVFCGFCEEVCPEAAIVMTRRYELATYDKGDFLLTKEKLLANEAWVHKELYYLGPAPAKRKGSRAGAGAASGAAGGASAAGRAGGAAGADAGVDLGEED